MKLRDVRRVGPGDFGLAKAESEAESEELSMAGYEQEAGSLNCGNLGSGEILAAKAKFFFFAKFGAGNQEHLK